MSSIVKKSSQFTPKLKKRPIRHGTAIATPPTTQTDSSASSYQEEGVIAPHTPAATQVLRIQGEVAASPLLQFALTDGLKSQKGASELDMDVDPMDTSKVPEEAIENEDEDDSENEKDDYGESEIFKQHREMTLRRRSSVAGHRRLSGIAAFRRTGSVSGTPGSVAPDGEERKNTVPVLIGIPVTKPVKRRSSTVAKGSKRSKSESHPLPKHVEGASENGEQVSDAEAGADSAVAVKKGTPEPNPVAAAQTQEEAKSGTNRPPFVYGIDPETGYLTKFKTLESINSDLKVAPPNLVTTIGSIKQIPRSLDKEDWRLLSEIEVSEDITMEELCKPTLPFGTFSDNYEKSVEAKKTIVRNRQKRTEARRLAREQRISYEEALRIASNGQVDGPQQQRNILDEPDEVQTSGGLKVSIVGDQMVVDQESTMVSKRTSTEAGNRVIEIENAFENPITSNSYSKLAHTDTWTDDELQQLYRALSTWGTDFTFIAQMFPYRTRRQIKRKFILEEKRNPQLVDLALRRQLPGNFREFEKSALSVSEWNALQDEKRKRLAENKPIDEIVSRLPTKARFELEIEELKREHQRHIEEITTEREKAIKEDLEASRKREIEIRTGAKPMTRTQMKAEFKKNEIVVGSIDDHIMPKERPLAQN